MALILKSGVQLGLKIYQILLFNNNKKLLL
jgi:hypothetical protein